MDPIKVLLSNGPRMVRDMLRRLICARSDLEIVGEVLPPLDLLLAVGQTGAEVVVVTLPESGDPGISSHLLAEYPDLVVLAVRADCAGAMLYHRRVHREPLGGMSGHNLLEVLLSARGERPEWVH